MTAEQTRRRIAGALVLAALVIAAVTPVVRTADVVRALTGTPRPVLVAEDLGPSAGSLLSPVRDGMRLEDGTVATTVLVHNLRPGDAVDRRTSGSTTVWEVTRGDLVVAWLQLVVAWLTVAGLGGAGILGFAGRDEPSLKALKLGTQSAFLGLLGLGLAVPLVTWLVP